MRGQLGRDAASCLERLLAAALKSRFWEPRAAGTRSPATPCPPSLQPHLPAPARRARRSSAGAASSAAACLKTLLSPLTSPSRRMLPARAPSSGSLSTSPESRAASAASMVAACTPTRHAAAASTPPLPARNPPPGALGESLPVCAILPLAPQADSHEKAQQRGRADIAALADQLSIRPREELAEAAHRLYRIALQRGFTRGRRTAQVAAACLYLVCRQESKPFLLIDFSDAIQVNVFTLGAVFLQLSRLLRLEEHPTLSRQAPGRRRCPWIPLRTCPARRPARRPATRSHSEQLSRRLRPPTRLRPLPPPAGRWIRRSTSTALPTGSGLGARCPRWPAPRCAWWPR